MDYELYLISRVDHLELQYYNAAGSVWVEERATAQGLHQTNLSGVAYTRTHSHISTLINTGVIDLQTDVSLTNVLVL